MQALLPVHIASACVALFTGYLALSVLKGGRLHVKSGIAFVYAMLGVAGTGLVLSVRTANVGNMLAAALTIYLVVTALTTVRPQTARTRSIDVAAMALAFGAGLAAAGLAFGAAMRPSGTLYGIPPPVYLIFGAVGWFGGAGDLQVLRSGPRRDRRRLARHLWRMCLALWVAAASFFLNPNRVPEAMRIPALLPIPVLIPIAAMIYWLVRLRVTAFRPPAVLQPSRSSARP